jgi:uncharacterized protein (TIGR00369 family)
MRAGPSSGCVSFGKPIVRENDESSDALAGDAPAAVLAHAFFRAVPHSAVLGLEVVGVEPPVVIARLPYQPMIVGNPYTGHIHSGAITTLIDQTSGVAVFCSLDSPEAIATLDLRVDHLRAAGPGKDVFARAECYRITTNIAFVQCIVYQDDPTDLIATSMSTFMRTANKTP